VHATSQHPDLIPNLGIVNPNGVPQHPEPLDAAVCVLNDNPGRAQDGVIYLLAVGELTALGLLERLLDADPRWRVAQKSQVLLERRASGQLDGVELGQGPVVHAARLGG